MVGKFSSPYQEQYIKVSRMRQTLNDLEVIIQDCEKTEILKQEAHSRENELLHHRISNSNRTAEREAVYNNELTKEIRILEQRVNILLIELQEAKKQLTMANSLIVRLKDYKNRKRIAFKKWLKGRLKK